MEVRLNSAVGYSKTPIEITGKLDGTRLQYDEAAHVIKMLAQKIYGINDLETLHSISVSYYADGELAIDLKGLGEQQAWLVRNTLMDHSNGRVVPDANMPLNARAVKGYGFTPSKSLADTLNAIAKKYDLTAELEQAVREVEEAKEAKRAAEAAEFAGDPLAAFKTKLVTARGTIPHPSDAAYSDEQSGAALTAIAKSVLNLDENARVFVTFSESGKNFGVSLVGDVSPAQAFQFRDALIRHSVDVSISEFNETDAFFKGKGDFGARETLINTINNMALAYGCQSAVAGAVSAAQGAAAGIAA